MASLLVAGLFAAAFAAVYILGTKEAIDLAELLGSKQRAFWDVQRVVVQAFESSGRRFAEAAVRSFQRHFGLVPDGIVGPGTWVEVDKLP